MAKKPAIAEPETVATRETVKSADVFSEGFGVPPTIIVREDAPAPSNVFTNTTEATIIHLGDGRKLAPGESAEVDPSIMALLRGDA